MKKIFLFTHSFPFSRVGEAFIDTELKIASTFDVEITLVPLYSSSYIREIPKKVKICRKLSDSSVIWKTLIFFKMLLHPLFIGMFFQNRRLFKKWNNLYYGIKYLYGGFLVKDFLLSNKDIFPEGSILYSFWLNYTALGFSLTKENSDHYKTCKFYSRAHRYDLYAEEVGVLIPYREKMLGGLNRVFSGSEAGVRFLSEKFPVFASIIDLGRLGVIPLNPKNKKSKNVQISLISCSNVVLVKRVCLIYNSIKQFCLENAQFKVSWIHIGDGSEMRTLQNLVNECELSNLEVNLVGAKMSHEVVEFLENFEFDAFLNLSSSEGLPVTLMMAISAGIPIIATDAGGSNEIANKDTGYLLPISFSQAEFSEAVIQCMDNTKLRESSFTFFLNNFSADKNYSEFYQKL